MFLCYDKKCEQFTVGDTVINDGDCITVHRLYQVPGCEDWDGDNMIVIDTGDWYAIEYYETDRGDIMMRGLKLETLKQWNIPVAR